MRIPYLSSMQVGLRRLLMATAILGLSLYFITLTPLFEHQLEKQVVEALEHATGSRVHVREFHGNVWTRQIVLRDVTMRATGKNEIPFFSAESVLVQLRLATIFNSEKELRLLRLQKPRLEVAFDAQGNSNLPQPGVMRDDPRRSPLDPLFSLAIRRMEVIDGLWIWDDQARKLNFDLERITASLNYDPARDRYDGAVAVRGTEKIARQKDAFAWNSQAHFILTHRELDVTEMNFETPHSVIRGQLVLRDFRNPVFHGGYQGTFDVAEAGALLNTDALREGKVAAKGSVHFDAKGGLRVAGDAKLEHGRLLTFHDLNGTSAFEATRENLLFNSLRMEALGGKLDGRMRIEHLDRDPRYSIAGHVEGLTFARVAEELESLSPSVQLTRVKLAAIIGGEVDVSFGGTSGVEVGLRGTLTDPPFTMPGYIPVHGHTDMRLYTNGERLVLHDTLLETAASRLTADGDAQFHVAFTTTNPKEFDWVGKLPITVGHHADFDGTLAGPLRSPQFTGHASFEQVVWPVLGRDYLFDRFQGNVTASVARIEIRDGRLDRGDAQILFNAAVPLVHGEVPRDAPVSASAELRQWDVGDALGWLKLDAPVKGALRGAITAAGTLDAPSARGSLEIVKGEAWGERFDSAAANIVWSGHHIEANTFRASRGRAKATGMLQFENDTQAYNFQLSATNLSVDDFPRFQLPHIKLTGSGEFQAAGKGVWEPHHIAPAGQATVRINNATVNGESAATLTGTIDSDGKKATLHVDAGRQAADASLELHEPYPFTGKLHTTSLDLDSLVEPYLEDRITISKHSQMDADATFQGEIQHLDKFAASAEIRAFTVSLHGVDLHNDGAWRLAYQDRVLKLDPMKLAGRDTSLVFQGSLGMPPAAPAQRLLDLRVEGDANLILLQTLRPDLTASGKSRLRMSLLGTWETPQFNGRAELEEAAIGSESFPSSLTHMNGALLFNRTGVRIEKLTGESGGGRLNLTGVLDYTRSPKTFQVRAEARGVRMRYPPGVSTVLDADLNLAGTPEHSQLTGEITIQRAGVNANFDLAEALAQVKQASAAPSEVNWARSLQLYVRVVSSDNIRFESGVTRNLQAQFDLRVRGTLADPALLGKVTIQEGKVTFAGTHYTINRGEIQFLNPFRIDPVISLDLSTRKQQYDISLDFAGPLDKLRVNYRSDPPLPVPDIQLLLVLGRAPTGGVSAASNPALAQVGSNTFLGDTTAATVSSRLGRLFGASSIKVDPQSGGPDTNPSARISVEQQVAQNVTLTVTTAITNTQQQIVQLEWTVSRHVSLLATRDQNGLFGVDFKYRKQIK